MRQTRRPILDQLIVRPDDPKKLLWWWCDALFMAPPVLARMYVATGDKKYLDYMDKEWWETSASLYNTQYHLYLRDGQLLHAEAEERQADFLVARQWMGDGRVCEGAGDDAQGLSDAAKYIAQYKEMADEIASIQGSDGLWRTGLLAPEEYELPENSGSAFFAYSLAWGINQGILDREEV